MTRAEIGRKLSVGKYIRIKDHLTESMILVNIGATPHRTLKNGTFFLVSFFYHEYDIMRDYYLRLKPGNGGVASLDYSDIEEIISPKSMEKLKIQDKLFRVKYGSYFKELTTILTDIKI